MDATAFIEKDSESKIVTFAKAYGCDIQDTSTTRLSDDERVKKHGWKIYFDRLRYGVFVGISRYAVIGLIKNGNVFATTDEIEGNCIEADDVVTVSWYGKRSGKTCDHEYCIELNYIVKDDKVIAQYTKML